MGPESPRECCRKASGPAHGTVRIALADVTSALAFWRPATGRHNIAEIALHHAYVIRAVRAQLTGMPAEPFVLEGEDWFDASDARRLSWTSICGTVESEQERLRAAVDDIEAGQIQLIKRLHES